MRVIAKITTVSVRKCMNTLELDGCRGKYRKLSDLAEKAGGEIHLLGELSTSGTGIPFLTLPEEWSDGGYGIPNPIRACAIDAVLTAPSCVWEPPSRKHWEQ